MSTRVPTTSKEIGQRSISYRRCVGELVRLKPVLLSHLPQQPQRPLPVSGLRAGAGRRGVGKLVWRDPAVAHALQRTEEGGGRRGGEERVVSRGGQGQSNIISAIPLSGMLCVKHRRGYGGVTGGDLHHEEALGDKSRDEALHGEEDEDMSGVNNTM